MTAQKIVTALAASLFTIPELNEVIETAQALAGSAESTFAKVFDLGDTVKLEGGAYAVVVRRNLHTVSVLVRGASEPIKVTPSDIVDLIEIGDADNFDYFDYFGTPAEA